MLLSLLCFLCYQRYKELLLSYKDIKRKLIRNLLWERLSVRSLQISSGSQRVNMHRVPGVVKPDLVQAVPRSLQVLLLCSQLPLCCLDHLINDSN